LLVDFVEAPETPGESKVAQQIKELTEKLEASNKRLEDEVKKRTETEKTVQQKEAERERNAAVAFAVSKIDPAKFELCAKEENRAEMAETAIEAVPLLIRKDAAEKLGKEADEVSKEDLEKHLAELTQDDYAAYFERAYEKLEAKLE